MEELGCLRVVHELLHDRVPDNGATQFYSSVAQADCFLLRAAAGAGAAAFARAEGSIRPAAPTAETFRKSLRSIFH